MSKLMLICGLMLLGSVPAQENVKIGTQVQPVSTTSTISQDMLIANIEMAETVTWSESMVLGTDPDCVGNAELDLSEIVYIEEEPKIELGFDTAEYLPEGFDPYKLYVDLNAVEYVEEQEEIDLGFDVADYLPASFDPYADPLGIEGINYMEAEEQIELGFDTEAYLPANFDPYASKNEAEEVTVL